MAPSAFDDVVESVRAALNAKRSEVAERIATLEHALRGYERALEFEIAESFATEHALKQPVRQERASEAALKLSRAVANLPELAALTRAPASSREPEPEPVSERDAAAKTSARTHSGKLVIIDRIVSHKHTEPVVAAARDARVPVAFAGQGGKVSLARALAQLEEMRRERG